MYCSNNNDNLNPVSACNKLHGHTLLLSQSHLVFDVLYKTILVWYILGNFLTKLLIFNPQE